MAMLKILESRDNSRLTEAIDRGFAGDFEQRRSTLELRRSALNRSIRNGLISLSRFACFG
jgi:hypothetical protein